MAGFGRLAAVEADRRQGASEAENYGRGPWQEGLRNSTLYVTLVALQCKCILAMGEGDSPPVRRTDEGRIYGCFPTTDGGPRPKRMASEHPCPKYHATLYLRMAYTVSTPRTTLL